MIERKLTSRVQWLADYAATHVERDVRLSLNVSDLTAFACTRGELAGGRIRP